MNDLNNVRVTTRNDLTSVRAIQNNETNEPPRFIVRNKWKLSTEAARL